ncbi:MAG: hypothetical protein R3B46_11750 [Phycisphaerales bacterium]
MGTPRPPARTTGNRPRITPTSSPHEAAIFAELFRETNRLHLANADADMRTRIIDAERNLHRAWERMQPALRARSPTVEHHETLADHAAGARQHRGVRVHEAFDHDADCRGHIHRNRQRR